MKPILFCGLVAAFGCGSASAAQDAARISAVVLYPGSATIERSAPVAAGTGRLEIRGLPANFDARTLRVDADAGIAIGEIAVQEASRTEAPGEREAELENRIQALKDQSAALEVEAKSAELVRDYLARLSTQGTDGDKPRPVALDPKALPAVLEAIRRGGGDAYATIQRVAVKKRELAKRIAALERDLARLKSGARDTRTLVVGYSATRAGELRASYQVANAGWRPAYRAALDSEASRIDLERQAAVTQRTGEDWQGVKLRLSTGQPRAAQVVDPATWQLLIRQPLPAKAAEAQSYSAPANAAMRAAGSPAPADALQVAEFQQEYATEFEVPGRVDIPADGRRVTVSLARQAIEVKQRLRVVPRRDAVAMVTAEAALPDGIWLPGEMQLYRDGAYTGSTYWQAQAKDKLVLPFGRDDRVQVRTSRIKDRRGNSGLIGQRAEREIATLYTITSRHKLPVELLVLEAAPVAVNDQIGVDASFDPKPQVKNWEEHAGVYAWEQSLAPGATVKLLADYTITYPKDVAVLGLP
jgi:uncharacterized protein (TIGR02231 family)